ncbi:DUF6090 family protein [Flavobacteriaceae bacterium S0862]|nr:DUF6090 family protein [Flavobacteriaceae bacterium S0862]
MIKFFRKIRYNLMEHNKIGKYFKYAIGEIILVMVGILLALQVNNWNEIRKKRDQEKFILERIKVDLSSDLELITYQIDKANTFTKQLLFCVSVMLNEKQVTREEFIENLSSILTIFYFDQNRTTFENIVSSGQLDYLQNQVLTDSIIAYYDDGSNIGWDSGLREYTRNIIAPYMLEFDHIPKVPQTSYRENASRVFTKIDVTKSEIKPKSVEDYKKNIFILNILRNKIYGMEGQVMEYEHLKKTIERLQEQITAEIDES